MNIQRLLEWDTRVSARLRIAEKPGPLRTLAIVLAHSGDSWFWWAGLALLWWWGDSFWRSWALTVLISIILLAVVVLAVKFSIRRPRPVGEWGAFYRNTDPHSFPSGHAARVILIACLATILGPWWLAVLLWIWAPCVALARVAMGVHYLSDVLAGMVLGLLAGTTVLLVRG